ncbi:hypothetical protein OHB14_36415 [Streptomyces sp. NBC_01613]|uniref:hypothetical protein n=1 Tax=Streptomyces sp. NBC_01613 TaxID=2975896 RepID=UPI0038661817
MASESELAAQGIAGTADVLPVPAGPQQPLFPPAPRDFEEKLRQDVARLQGLLAEAVRDAHLARRERDLMRERVSEPYGCKHCGTEKRSHGRRYVLSAGVHSWERPSDEQVKARMLARRVARSPLPRIPELDQAHVELMGLSLALYEEELETARLRLALASAQRGRRELRSRVAELVALLPTEPMPLVMLAEGVQVRAAWAVWEQVAGVLGVELPTRPRVDESAGKLAALLAPSEGGASC